MGSPTSPALMSTQHTQLLWQVQVSSMPHLPLSLLDIPWYWHLQYLGISTPAETLPTTNGLFYTRVNDANLPCSVKLSFASCFYTNTMRGTLKVLFIISHNFCSQHDVDHCSQWTTASMTCS